MVDGSKVLKDYFKKLAKAYQKADKLSGEKHNVFRGRKRSISGLSEDFFAEMLSEICSEEKDMLFLVDYRLSLGSRHIYPDILVLEKKSEENYEVLWMVDLKTDVGYIRDNDRNRTNESRKTYVKLAEDLRKKCEDVRKAAGENLLRVEDPENAGKSIRLSTVPELCYDMVVISANNSGKENAGKAALLDRAKDRNENIWVLFNNLHPNRCCDDLGEKIKKLEINVDGWNRIVEQVKGRKSVDL